jgi:hypothetical protein
MRRLYAKLSRFAAVKLSAKRLLKLSLKLMNAEQMKRGGLDSEKAPRGGQQEEKFLSQSLAQLN